MRHPFARPDNVAVNNTKTNIYSLKYHAKRMFSFAFPPPTTPQQLYPHKISRPIHQQPAYVTAIKSPLEELQLNMRSPQANGLTVSRFGNWVRQQWDTYYKYTSKILETDEERNLITGDLTACREELKAMKRFNERLSRLAICASELGF